MARKSGKCTCRRCRIEKSYDAFPRGRSKRGRLSTICGECWERSRQQREEWISIGRVCPRCGELRSCPDEIGLANCPVCKPCQRKKSAERQRERRRDPRVRAQMVEKMRKWRDNNPDQARKSQRQYRDRVMADPKRAQEWRENNRIYHRLWRIRKGMNVRTISENAYQNGNGRRGRSDKFAGLPSRPLGIAVERMIKDENPEVVCASLDISPRNLLAWRTGERTRVQFPVADRVLTNSGLNWWDIWNEDTTDPDELRRVGTAFGECEEAA